MRVVNDLRQLAMLGFGSYGWEFDGSTQMTSFNPSLITVQLPALNAPTATTRAFKLVGNLYVPDTPGDLVNYYPQFTPISNPGIAPSLLRPMFENPEPLMIFLSGEQPQLNIYVQLRGYLNTYLAAAGPTPQVDVLTGSQEQLVALINFLSANGAPKSIISDAIDALGGAASVVADGGWY